MNIVSTILRNSEDRSSAADKTHSSPLAQRVEVILVHGTFAKNAPWTTPTSQLCRSISAEFGEAVVFTRFSWSGGNTFIARKRAAAALEKLLERPISDGSRRFVIGHSHGGSIIAAVASRRPDLVERCSGCIFLSTPFIQVQINPRAKLVEAMFVSMVQNVFLWTSFFCGIFTYAFLIVESEQFEPTTPFLVAVTVAFSWFALGRFIRDYLLGLSTVRAIAEAYRRIIRNPYSYSDQYLETSIYGEAKETPSQKAVRKLKRHFEIKGLNNKSSMFVRINGDEASAFLATSQFVSVVIARLFDFLLWLQEIISPTISRELGGEPPNIDTKTLAAKFNFLFTVIFFVYLPFRSLINIHPEFVDRFLFIKIASEFFFLCFNLVPLSLSILLLISLAVMPAAMLSFGGIVFLASLYVHFSAETTPPGRWTLFQFDEQIDDEQWGIRSGLAHSKSYEDPRALAAIVKWMRQRIELDLS